MKYLFLFVLMYVGLFVQGQSLTPELLSSGSSEASAGGAQLSWSVGEMAVETHSAGSHKLTEGFHQPNLTITEITEKLDVNLAVNVFPNPTSDEFTIATEETELSYILTDLSGKVIQKGTSKGNKTTVAVNGYPEGTYLLKVTSKHNFRTFKIIKF